MGYAQFAALTVVNLWVFLNLYTFHKIVQSEGSWYNELKLNQRYTYYNRVKYTLRNRVNVGRWGAIIILGGIALYGLVYVFTTGVVELLW